MHEEMKKSNSINIHLTRDPIVNAISTSQIAQSLLVSPWPYITTMVAFFPISVWTC